MINIDTGLIAALRKKRRRMRVRAGLTNNVYERAVLQASAVQIDNEIEEARVGIRPVRASSGGFEGAVIVLLCDHGEVEYADGEHCPMHCTICYLGKSKDLDGYQRNAARNVMEQIASNLKPFEATALSPARFGDEDVMLVEAPEIQQARDIAMADNLVGRTVDDYPDKHPHFIPHVAGTDDAPYFDRVGLWLGDEGREELPLGGMSAAVFDPSLHPRGRDGQFIEVGGLVKLFGFGMDENGQRTNVQNRRGRVEKIDGPDDIWVQEPDGGPRYKVRSSQVERLPEPKAYLNDVPGTSRSVEIWGADKEPLAVGGEVEVSGLHGFQHGQRGDPVVKGEIAAIAPADGTHLGDSVITVKVTDSRWDPAQFGATIDVRPSQVAKPGFSKKQGGMPPVSKPPKAPKATDPQYVDTGIPPPRHGLPEMVADPDGPNFAPLQTPAEWEQMTPDARKQWVQDKMEADLSAWRGKPVIFDVKQYDSGIALNLANTWRELANWDPATARRIDDFVPEGMWGGAIAVAHPGTEHPGGIGPVTKEIQIAFNPMYFRSMKPSNEEYASDQKMTSHGSLSWSMSSKYNDPTLTLVHEFSHQRQFRYLNESMTDVGSAWSPVVMDDGFGMFPDSSNWTRTQELRYAIPKLTPTKYGHSKTSEGYAEAWTARLTGDSSDALDSALDEWGNLMGLSEHLPPDRYTSTTSYADLTPDQRDQFWAHNGPYLDLPGMRDHYPEAAETYDQWRTGQAVDAGVELGEAPAPPGAPSPDSPALMQTINTPGPAAIGTEGGYWDMSGDEPRLVQDHDALVRDALWSMKGDWTNVMIHMAHERRGDPQPDSGSGKIMRAQAKALMDELATNSRPNPMRLYRGATQTPTGLRAWSQNRRTANRFAKLSGGQVYVLEPGEGRGIRIADYINSGRDQEEQEWIIDSDQGEAPAATPPAAVASALTAQGDDMTSFAIPMCYSCSHLHDTVEMQCDAYPAGIPDEILESRVDHRQPYTGDQDIQFEQNPGMPEPDFVRLGFDQEQPTGAAPAGTVPY